MGNYFYCRIRPERLLYDAERDLLAIAKFLVSISLKKRLISKRNQVPPKSLVAIFGV